MKTGKEYIQSIRDMHFELYIDGGKASNLYDNPKIRPAIDAVAQTYDFAFDPKLQDQFLTKSSLTGETISRFQHIPQGTEDLIRKVSITRYANRQLGCCSFQCAQNIFAPLLYITKKIDRDKGTRYHENALNWIRMMQREDLLSTTESSRSRLTWPVTRKTLANGWLHTGDLGYMDEDGWVYFVDRKKDMIKTGGENVSSQEVEGLLMRHPKLAMAAVIGLPDPYWMELVTAVVVPKPGMEVTPEEIISFSKENMAGYKVPKKVIVRPSLPMTASGKILKRELRREFSEAAGK